MKKRIIYIIIGLLLVSIVTISVISRKRSRLIKVKYHTTAAEAFTREVSSNGEIAAKTTSRIVSPVSGTVSAIYVETGDRVEIGEILLTLDKNDLALNRKNLLVSLETTRMLIREELLSLRTAYTQAHTGYEQAERKFNRTTELHKIGSASDEELRLATDAFTISGGQLNSAKQRLNFKEGRSLNDPREASSISDDSIVENSAEVQKALSDLESLDSTIEDFSFISPIDGVVTEISIEEGSVLGPGTPAVIIHDLDNLEIITNIDEVDLSYLSQNQEARIESDSFIGKELTGYVTKIAPIIKKIGDSRVCEIRLELDDDPEKLARAGASCSIFITVEKKESVPAIPVEAYFTEDGKKYVFLLKEGEFKETFITVKQEIETGILGIETLEVITGLNIGDKIAIIDSQVLIDGDEVELEEEESKEEKSE
jgi:HlyD family secretion protein